MCPHCGTIHDYREQRIKDIPAFEKEVVLVLRKRRLHCHHCVHHFHQKVITTRLKSLKEMHMITETLEDSETVFLTHGTRKAECQSL